MFSSALKSISATNITANYSIASTATSQAGPWRIYDAKKKSTGKAYSVFVFDKKTLDAGGSSLGGRSGGTSVKRAVEEVVERLRKEASSLAKLRHPSILELVEPVEETRGGGLQFVTEAVTASLASALHEKDDQERSGGPGGRGSRYVTEDADGVRRRRELELDELEVQKGLLQVSKALEFLHDNAGLLHGNLTPDAILINAKSDWKISGLAFCSPVEGSTKPTSIQGVNLYEVLNPDPRLPRFVQLNLDYTSPDFVMDNNMTASADMFSLGLLSVALYNSPHRSPLESHGSLSAYRKLFSSSSTIPSASNKFLSKRPLPKDLTNHVLPRLITRRPAQRMTAKEFQESEFFDNVLISTIRFLDAFPAKTPNEKNQFMRGLNKVLPSFPKSVIEKKLLPALLEELKDRDLLSLILQNVFKILSLLPSSRRAFVDKVRPALKDIFVVNAKQAQQDKDPARDAGLMVFLENLSICAENCSGKEFKDDIFPVLLAAIECPTHNIIDAAMRSLPVVLPVLDFSTIKGELFPVIAAVFTRTNSLAIKVRGLQSFVILCGGSADAAADDGLNGLAPQKKTSSSSALDKYTMQEKIVPLVRGIKTKEPAVMMAALNVLRIVGQTADADFVAMDILPILWSMSLGPLLELKQFQTFMELIKLLSSRVEEEQTRKLQELGGTNGSATVSKGEDMLSFGGLTGTAFDATGPAGNEDDFESLVKGRSSTSAAAAPGNGSFPRWDDTPNTTTTTTNMSSSNGPGRSSGRSTPSAPAFSWSTTTPAQPTSAPSVTCAFTAQQPSFRTVTPDMNSFASLTPTSTQFSQPLQPVSQQKTAAFSPPPAPQQQPPQSSSINWGSGSSGAAASNPWASSTPSSTAPNYSSGAAGLASSMAVMSLNSQQRPTMGASSGSFSLPPPPAQGSTGFGTAAPQSQWGQQPMSMSSTANTQPSRPQQQPQQQPQASKSGLDKYESLI
ncbi:Protein kinase-like protein-like protein [Emericellopsis cladophorae]|uniref:Protein kinase-like protein-like protein n=1 Tax=Emericellopsis cladophorae TaxID=2686198 RepID=A0A9P9Y7D9_9HYPO|nr:Protein kinase-like protein-like protein [Emericellopsis cladophorae]KAI6784244.1 Protein kinase-like protein-like protein [Emericellopsis cladophorae]